MAVVARHGSFRQGPVRLGGRGGFRPGGARRGKAGHGTAGKARQGPFGHGRARRGWAQHFLRRRSSPWFDSMGLIGVDGR